MAPISSGVRKLSRLRFLLIRAFLFFKKINPFIDLDPIARRQKQGSRPGRGGSGRLAGTN
jgi:hypothetical protein